MCLPWRRRGENGCEISKDWAGLGQGGGGGFAGGVGGLAVMKDRYLDHRGEGR